MKRLIFLLSLTGLIAASAGLTSCRLASNSRPSAIVIAVDQLGVNQINCHEEDPDLTRSGIALLCQESVRFTHAYTTSLLSGPALTSVLTGQYPFQHGLRGNKKNFLSSNTVTLAEVAQRQQVATSFFSGGAPILRKLNLQQGFEVFDDHFAPSIKRLHRPFSKLQKLFENWLLDIQGRSFLSVFYVPDLAMIQTATQNDLGELRNLSYDSQLEEFDESLFHFIQNLKQRKIWDSTMIVLVGLNGPETDERTDELFNTNLYSERTQVALLIKPAQKPRDEGLNWSFDSNVNLADIGVTLLDLYGTAWKANDIWPL
ncbi:MAG: sulfatase-like hydrolase/transferase, partial [Pseudobdellovibrionaceae bacterium]